MNHDIPERPWELDKLENTKSPAVIRKLKAHFARYGSPCELVSDNGSQFVPIEFQKFVRDWHVEPHNSKANGKVETAVKSAKQLLRKVEKINIWPYWPIKTPRHKELGPAQLNGS